MRRRQTSPPQLIDGSRFATFGTMPDCSPEQVRQSLEVLYRSDSGRILATLVRLIEDLDLAEDAMQEAFSAALNVWQKTGIPENPRPWLISTARFKAIDAMRRRARFAASQQDLMLHLEAQSAKSFQEEEENIEDDRLRLIFVCCHPSLPPEAHVALTLRELCGLTTEEIARGFLIAPRTLAQRIVRAKATIRDKGIPFQVPSQQDLPQRLSAVLQVIYLVFNEGHSATAGTEVTRSELTGEAIRLGRLVCELLPEPEAMGLLALMLLQESRRASRTSSAGDLILLEQQNRALWNKEQIAEGIALVERALVSHHFGPYTLQAAIAAVHAEADSAAATDWRQIVMLYDRLLRIQRSPVIELNRAVASAMCHGLESGLSLIDDLLARGELEDYHLAHAARADLCRRLGRTAEARSSYERALALAQQEPERRFLQDMLRRLE
ncbi:MAG TPA: RNA polymerase sigma factor [Bryobacteraceae bacterium]|nr:RNA polymerase sigma factor [Bryobacteraceae bacterium]